jgi:transposase
MVVLTPVLFMLSELVLDTSICLPKILETITKNISIPFYVLGVYSYMNTERSNSTLNPTPTPVDDMPLPSDVLILQAMIRELLDALKKEQREREGVQQRLDLLLRKLYGPKAERFNPEQPWLLPEMATDTTTTKVPTEESPTTEDANGAAKKRPRNGGGRKKLPDDLERIRIEHKLSEAERMCPCCNQVCVQFGEDVSEQLDYHPGSLFVNQHVRFKYACTKCRDHITVGHVPIAVINKGLPGPGLLAHIAASKYADHLPLHRLERILARHGVELSRKTMCDWMAHVANLLNPLVDLMANLVRESKALHTDATKMPYLDPDVKGKSLSGQMWAFVGDRDHPVDVFAFGVDHSALCIDAFLKDHHYQGYLNADAHNIYDHLFTSGVITELGCWTHARRKFYDAKDSDAQRSTTALAYVRQLYAIEEEARVFIAAQKLQGPAADDVFFGLRQTKSLTVLTTFKTWLEAEQPKVLPKSLIGLAIAYTLRHWAALERYTTDGFLDIDNNIAERALRQIAVGRKNWLFAGSADGARTAATLFTIASTCHRRHIDVFAYLHDILQRLAHDPNPPPEQLREWLPDRWKPPPKPTNS